MSLWVRVHVCDVILNVCIYYGTNKFILVLFVYYRTVQKKKISRSNMINRFTYLYMEYIVIILFMWVHKVLRMTVRRDECCCLGVGSEYAGQGRSYTQPACLPSSLTLPDMQVFLPACLPPLSWPITSDQLYSGFTIVVEKYILISLGPFSLDILCFCVYVSNSMIVSHLPLDLKRSFDLTL